MSRRHKHTIDPHQRYRCKLIREYPPEAVVTRDGRPLANIFFLDFYSPEDLAKRNICEPHHGIVIPVPKEKTALRKHVDMRMHLDRDKTNNHAYALPPQFCKDLTKTLNYPEEDYGTRPQFKWISFSVPDNPSALRISRFMGGHDTERGLYHNSFADIVFGDPDEKVEMQRIVRLVLGMLNEFEERYITRHPLMQMPTAKDLSRFRRLHPEYRELAFG